MKIKFTFDIKFYKLDAQSIKCDKILNNFVQILQVLGLDHSENGLTIEVDGTVFLFIGLEQRLSNARRKKREKSLC